MTPCPRCSREIEDSARICPHCGVIPAKVRGLASPDDRAASVRNAPRPMRRPESVRPTAVPDGPLYVSRREADVPGGHALRNVAIAAAIAVAAVGYLWSRPANVPPPPPAPRMPSPAPKAPTNALEADGFSREDIGFLQDVAKRLAESPDFIPADPVVERVGRIWGERVGHEQLKPLVTSVYIRRGVGALRAGDTLLAAQRLADASMVDDQNPHVYAFEANLRMEEKNWSAVVSSIGRYTALSGPPSVGLSVVHVVALLAQDRRAEAADVLSQGVFETCPNLTAPLDIDACRTAERMRQHLGQMANAPSAPTDLSASPEPERVRASLSVDPDKNQIQSDKFDVRFDGESQTGVARDVLFVLDRAFACLVSTYFVRPEWKIPVVLHFSRDYYQKTGAPWWSGGVYSSHNGAIQIPIRGLPSTLPKEMEDVLVHELSHAFVDEMSGGEAGRELQEGLAQFVEGKRIEDELDSVQLRQLARSGSRDVGSFYMQSLVIAQHLVQSRGQGQVNTLLKAMKEKRSEDAAYRQVFGRSKADVQRDILETFWRRYS